MEDLDTEVNSKNKAIPSSDLEDMILWSELERAMMKEYKGNMSQFDSSHFDIYGYINNLFPTDETLDNLDSVIEEFDSNFISISNTYILKYREDKRMWFRNQRKDQTTSLWKWTD